jgi:outer membrane protein OmpA-like peptidoglycan-associated protein
MRRQRSQLKDLVACAALLLMVAQSAESSPSADAPPNTERTMPSSPPSDAVTERLAAAAADLPKTAPASRIELSDTVQQSYFASGSDELTPAAAARLDEFVSSLHGVQVQRVLVEAHTDAQRLVREAKRKFVTNQGLSEARAARVAQYLQKALALPEDALAIQG